MKKTHTFFSKIKYLFILSLFLFGLSSFAQKANNNISNEICNTWYEWPHENANGNTVYKTVKYEPIPGIDKQDEAFSKLIISGDGTFIKTQYCGYCPAVKLEESKGKCEINNTNGTISSIQVTYNNAKQISPLTVVSSDKDKLVINFQHIINTK